jgi:hypothetical protein
MNEEPEFQGSKRLLTKNSDADSGFIQVEKNSSRNQRKYNRKAA